MQLELLYQKFLESSGVTTDTRNIGAGNIFFALKGEKFNANEFAEEAFNKGAKYVVIDELKNEIWKTKFGERLILVADVLKTLQQLAGYHRSQFKFPVLAITGSNGKTTTKELLAAVLSKKSKTAFTKGNFNNHIGVPRTLLEINKEETEFAIIEMGANHVGEIASYCEYTKPDFGLITNVGYAHLEGFGSFEGVVKGKTELYADLAKRGGKVFVYAENELLLKSVSNFKFQISSVISYGKSSSAPCSGEIIPGGEFLKVKAEGEVIQTKLVGEYNFENVMSAVCVGKYFGVELKQIKEAIENYVPSNNRSQKIAYGTNTVILDAYNANPSSMIEALKNFEKILVGDNTNKGVAIIGQMMELGEYSKAEHEKIAAAVSSSNWANVQKVFVGYEFKEVVGADTSHGMLWFETTDEAKAWFKQQQFENAYILIKGSRKNELEKILKD